MNFLSVLYAKAGITVDGVTTLNNTATGLTPATNDNSTKLATTGYVKNQNYYPYPTGTTSQYVRGDGSLATFPTVAAEAQRLITEVYNESGATLTKGTVVYINGGHGNLPTITKALATSDATSAQTYGVVQTDITNNNNGFVVVIGSLMDLNTNAYANGTILYLSSTVAGEWTSVKQYAPAHLVYVGIVSRSHPTQGIVEVRIQNGYEMDELHNVAAQSPNNGDILQYVSSTSLWTKIAGNTTAIAEGTNFYYTAARFNSAFSGKTTTDLTEGTNLYYTATRFNTAFSAKSTTDLAEGTNLYFTDTRARAAITLTTTGTSGVATYTGGVLNIPNYGSALSGYLPLSGGTLTGALYGTTATFSGIVSAKGSAPYYQWLNASDVRLGYIQHNGTDLVIATDTGDVVLSPTGKVGIKNSSPSQNLTVGDGTAIMDITQTLLFVEFQEGKFNPDLMFMLVEPVAYMIIALAEKLDLPMVIYRGEEEDEEVEQQYLGVTVAEDRLKKLQKAGQTGRVPANVITPEMEQQMETLPEIQPKQESLLAPPEEEETAPDQQSLMSPPQGI